MRDGGGIEGRGPARLSARRLWVIYNPTAGRRARGRLKAWLAALESLGARVTLHETTGPGHATELARAADPALCDAVGVAGGDGTINEVVNGLAGSSLPMAIFPLGTANVLAAELGLPSQPDRLAEIAAFGPAREIWPGEVAAPGAPDGRLFLLMAGVGFDAAVIQGINLPLKRRTGKFAYAVSILDRLRVHRFAWYRAVVDNMACEPASLIAARAHFYGGRFVLAPDASLDEPRFQSVLFDRNGRCATLRYLAWTGLGRLARRSDVRIVPSTTIELSAPVGAPVHVDGDVCARLPVTIRLATRSIGLIGPLATAV
jgi:YegS/Rv2252/BmrU family lipid kinase